MGKYKDQKKEKPLLEQKTRPKKAARSVSQSSSKTRTREVIALPERNRPRFTSSTCFFRIVRMLFFGIYSPVTLSFLFAFFISGGYSAKGNDVYATYEFFSAFPIYFFEVLYMVTCIAYFDSISFKRYAPGKSEVFSYFLSTICICGGFVYILRAFISHEKLLSLFFAIMLHKKIVSMVFLIYMWLTAYDLCKTAVSREELTFGTAGKCICVARKKLIFYLITSIMLFIVILTLFTLKADMHFGKLLSRLLVEEDYYVNTL